MTTNIINKDTDAGLISLIASRDKTLNTLTCPIMMKREGLREIYLTQLAEENEQIRKYIEAMEVGDASNH
jgi:hypothetical protein